MEFIVPTNWQDDLIPGLPARFVSELYGKLAVDFVGGGRASAILNSVSRKKAASHIKQAHKHGFKFNYLLNSTCLDNWELTKSGRMRIEKLVDWLIVAGVDSVTVSMPFILEFVKRKFPSLKVNVSVQENVNTVSKAVIWDKMGADKITLSVIDANRDFSLLRNIRSRVNCKLQLIANLKCLAGCHLYKYHSNINAHGSQSKHILKGYLIDYCTLCCSLIRAQQPVEYIKSMWIRPEDVHYYEELGVDSLKLVGRQMPTPLIHKIAKAYVKRTYEGNLLDILAGAKKNFIIGNKKVISYFKKIKYFFKPQHVNPFRLQKAQNLFTENHIFIDNCALDGFLDYFLKGKCDLTCKPHCTYCYDIAKHALKIDSTKQEEHADKIESFLDNLYAGKMFYYF